MKKTAFLDKGVFQDEKLLDNCVLEIEHQLEERPEIIVYGKVCRQSRNVGFFLTFQKIPKQKRIKQSRISFTFRKHIV